jgi:hypothetical protein
MPYKVLEELVRVFLLYHDTRCFDNIAGIIDEMFAIWAQFRSINDGVVEEVL